MEDKYVKLEYRKQFRTDFTGNYVEIIYDREKDEFERIYFYDSENGTLEYRDKTKVVHRWEDEDEAQAGSYLNRRYTSMLLDGIASDPNTEDRIIESNLNFLKTLVIKEKDMEIIKKAVKCTIITGEET